jgi:hypothetical protein
MIASALALTLLLQTPRDTPVQSPAGAAVIGGLVTTGGEAGVKTPLRRAAVSITGTGIIGQRQVMTDDGGRFIFADLMPGRFTLTVEKRGYLKTYVGSRRPGRPPSTPIALVAGQRVLDLAVTVARGAVVEGTVRDERGVAIPTAQVSAQQLIYVAGAPRYVPAGNTPGRVITDDRGRYRLYGLPPGEYIIEATGGTAVIGGVDVATDEETRTADDELQRGASAMASRPREVRTMTHAPVYAPGVPDIQAAETISLALSEERSGVDIVNRFVGAAKVDMAVTGPTGQPLTNVGIGIANLSRRAIAFSPGIVRPDAEGRFVLPGLSPGTYWFYGFATEPGVANAPASLFLSKEVAVDGVDLSNVALTFTAGQTVSGRLAATATMPVLTTARLSLTPVVDIAGTGISPQAATVSADGTFKFVNVGPGHYRLALGGMPGWSLASAKSAGRDTLDEPLDVTGGVDIDGIVAAITDQPTEISGTVTDAAGRPSPEFTALVFPADRAFWLTSPRRTSGLVKIASDGKFRVEGLPPGDYLLAVIVDADPQQLNDRAFLEQIATGAIAIHLGEGQKLVQDLKIGG